MIPYKNVALKIFITAIILCLSGIALADTYTPIAYDYNSVNYGRNANYPTGSPVILGGVPFNIPSSPNLNTWDSNTGYGGRYLDIPINTYGVEKVYTLINNSWGAWGGVTLTSLIFTAFDGSTFTKDLYDGNDIRDWYHGAYPNDINGTTTINVYDNGSSCVDRQEIDLPIAFANQYLVSMRITDNGGPDYHRAFLYGVTVESEGTPPVPEPTTMLLLGLGLTGIAGIRRKI